MEGEGGGGYIDPSARTQHAFFIKLPVLLRTALVLTSRLLSRPVGIMTPADRSLFCSGPCLSGWSISISRAWPCVFLSHFLSFLSSDFFLQTRPHLLPCCSVLIKEEENQWSFINVSLSLSAE